VARLLEPALELDALRQPFLEAIDRDVHALAQAQDVVTVFLVRGDDHRSLAVEARKIAPGPGIPAHVREIAYADGATVHRGNHGIAHLIERCVGAGRLEAEAAGP